MSERPRSHQVADRSRQAFEAALPPAWTFSELKDYGLDGQVEVFEKGGERTGLQFFVQFKATDTQSRKAPLSIRFPRKTAEYYRKLAIPVLICRFHASANDLFVRWFHEQPLPGPDRKTVTFQLGNQSMWQDDRPQLIVDELRLFRALRSPGLPLPLLMALTAEPPAEFDAVIAAQLRRAAVRVPTVIRLTDNVPRSARPEIILLPGKIRVNLAGLTSYSLPLHTTAEPPPSLAPDVFLALAMLLGGLGHFAPAAVLVDSFFPEATLHNNPEILWKSMLCLFQARRIHEALQLAESYIERDPLKSGVLILPALAGEPPLTTAEDQALRAFFERNLVRAKRLRHKASIAAASYSLGQYHHARGDHQRALDLFRAAAVSDPTYRQQAYYWEGLAGSSFLLGKFDQASQCYDQALKAHRPGGDCRAKLADALLFSGRYRKAELQFARYLRTSPEAPSEWRLKHFLLKRIREVLGISNQNRRQARAVELSGVEPDDDPSSKRLISSLKVDALWGGAWFNLAVEAAGRNDLDAAFQHFLCAAVSWPSDVAAWGQAAILCLRDSSSTNVLPYIVNMAFRSVGERFYEAASDVAARQAPAFPRKHFLAAVRELIDATPVQCRLPVTVRMRGPGRGHVEITV